jgi:hypothetical protein
MRTLITGLTSMTSPPATGTRSKATGSAALTWEAAPVSRASASTWSMFRCGSTTIAASPSCAR